MIFIDSREPDSTRAAIAQLGLAYSVALLPVGDIAIDAEAQDPIAAVNNGFVIERKTIPDLLASIADRRLFEQADALAQTKFPIFLIEGQIINKNGLVETSDASRWSYNAVQMALLRVQLAGCAVITWDGELAEFVRLLHQRSQKAARGKLHRYEKPVRMPILFQDERTAFLCGLPKIGSERASEILEQSGSIIDALVLAAKRYPDVRDFLGVDNRFLQCLEGLLSMFPDAQQSSTGP
jgi:ERCC4-type nuclease